MNVTLPPDLAAPLSARAGKRQVSVDNLVREALQWYLAFDESLLDELNAWQEVRDEALTRVEESLP